MEYVFPLGSSLLVLTTSVWVALDARKHRIPTYGDTYNINTGAFCWFLGCILIWIIAFPSYLIRRAAVLRKREARGLSVEEENHQLKEEVRRLKLRISELIEHQEQRPAHASNQTGIKAAPN